MSPSAPSVRASAPALAPRLFAGLCVAAGLVPLANILSAGRAVPWYAQASGEWAVRGSVLLLLALLAAIVGGARLDRLRLRAADVVDGASPRAFAACVSLGTAIAAALLARYCFAGEPFTSDEMAQLWHARILLSGHLAIPVEAHPEFFNTAPVLDGAGRWVSQYPVGGPALIALGILAGAAWLVNPILLGVAAWQLYRFLSAAFDERVARRATLLFAASPMVLIMGASQMSHVPALAAALAALAALVRWDAARDARTARRQGIVIGAALGVLATIRPLDAVLVALPVAAVQLAALRRAPARWRSLALQLLAGAIPVAFLLFTNARTTGSAFLFGYDALNGPGHRLGFHVDPTGAMHTPLRGVILASSYLLRLDRFLLEWPLPALLFVAVGLVSLARPSRWDLLLVALATTFVAGYGAYWFDGFFAGPRFLFTALPAFLYFVARAPDAIGRLAPNETLRRAAPLLVPLCIATAWLGPIGVSSARARVASYHEQRTKLKTDVAAQLDRERVHDAVVLVNESWRGRLLARLRAAGLQQFAADRALSTLDACALETALDASDTATSRAATAAPTRVGRILAAARAAGRAEAVEGLPGDAAIALVPGSRPTPRCLAEVEADARGSMPYAWFLARQRVMPDGRIGGDVVFVRDLGVMDTTLRARFAGRRWYRYRVPSGLDDSGRVFLPINAPAGVMQAGAPRAAPGR